MNYVWKRISEKDIESLVVKYGLNAFERRIIELRREDKPLNFIADEIGYTVRTISRISKNLLEKIKDDI